LVRFSDILKKIAKNHGAKPSSPKPLDEKEHVRPDLSGHVNAPRPQTDPAPPALRGEPTQEINKGIMEQLFRSVLDTPPEGTPAAGAGSSPEASGGRPASASDEPIKRPKEIRRFRNHAELLKFASLLINDIEDAMQDSAG
jgi:hypothetical protein